MSLFTVRLAHHTLNCSEWMGQGSGECSEQEGVVVPAQRARSSKHVKLDSSKMPLYCLPRRWG